MARVLQGSELLKANSLPQLPSNAQYAFHENKCYDWGTFGWALSSGKVELSRYKHIIFMNSSIRGPFLPLYWPVSALRSSFHLASGAPRDQALVAQCELTALAR